MKKSVRFLTALFVVFLLAGSLFAQTMTPTLRTEPDSKSKVTGLRSPGAGPESATLQYDTGVNGDAIGLTTGGTFEVSAHFPAALVGPLTGQGLLSVEIYINDVPTNTTLIIYGDGTPTTPGSVLYTEDVTASIVSGWNTITLAAPLVLDGTDIWVGYEVTHDGGFYPCGVDITLNVPEGDWIYSADLGGGWQHMGALGLPYTWNIHAFVGNPNDPGAPSNPLPADGALGLPLTGNTASWTNGANTETVDLYFSTDEALVTALDPSVRVETGSLINSSNIPDLNYSTRYFWRVVDINAAEGSTAGPVWDFTAMRDPSSWFEDFEAGLGAWTVSNAANGCVWMIDDVTNADYVMPATSTGNVAAANADDCGSTGVYPMATWLTLNAGVNLSAFADATLEFDMDFNSIAVDADSGLVQISPDGGATWLPVDVYTVDARGVHQIYDVSSIAAGHSNVLIRFYYWADGWNWSFAIDNVTLYGTQVIPVELTSFTAAATNGDVVLNWATATETNNSGFSVERRTETGEYAAVGFVEGHGTSTELQRYTFNDAQVPAGNYTYRLKQVDFDGTYAYSEEVNVVIGAPTEFALDQNFPNPFNPSTTINFALASDSKVTLKVFNTLGEEVATLVNKDLSAGAHTVSFDASSLNSGVYFYRLEATGSNGKNFNDVKKMILMK